MGKLPHRALVETALPTLAMAVFLRCRSAHRRLAAPVILHPQQAYHPNQITPAQLLDHTPTPLQSPARRNTTTIVELHHRRLGSSSFHLLRSTPTCTSPPARFPLVPWSSLASFPLPPATTVAGIWPASSSFSVLMNQGPNCVDLNLPEGLAARF
jgi:hypothetical protein